jgi:LacI family repressor for deo operon, udp, cdd, tsx, nupC, and nupG
MDQKREKARIQDVADAAGVSIATVSRAINNKTSVREATYNKILKAMQQVGYDNFSIKHESKLILILLPDINNPFYCKVAKGISSAAGRQGYQEIIVRTDSHPLTYSFIEDIVSNTHAEGVITLDPIPSKETLEMLRSKFPIVQCAEYNEESAASYVSIDDMSAAKTVVEYMISKGKRRIALLNGPLKYKYAKKRQEGYLEALKEANIEPIPSLIVHLPEFSYDAAVSVATQLLTMNERPDAIFAVSDVFAVSAIKAAKRLGLEIPKDLGIVGFDNTDISIMYEPALTTVKQPQFQLGFLACEMLIEQIRDISSTPRQIMLDAELIVRESL